MNLVEKLKTRWNLKSSYQIVIILIVFSLTGFTAVYLKDFIFEILGITKEVAFWIRTLVWLVTIFPLYYVFLLIYGTLLGQREFFWWFAKKSFSRFAPNREKKATNS